MEPSDPATPGTPPPKRRRRRWLIVAVVLILVSGVAWWEWPRGDARFVGKWSVNGGPLLLMFRTNGTAVSYQGAGDRLLSAWRIEGQYLLVGPKVSDRIGQALSIAEKPLKAITGYRIDHGDGENEYEIVEVSESAIQLRDTAEGQVVKLTRIPE